MIECHCMHAPFNSPFIWNFLTVNKVNHRINLVCRNAAILLCYVLGAPLFLLPQCESQIKSQSKCAMEMVIISTPIWSICAVSDLNVRHAAVGTSALFAFTIKLRRGWCAGRNVLWSCKKLYSLTIFSEITLLIIKGILYMDIMWFQARYLCFKNI
jgi:hypothetical protein